MYHLKFNFCLDKNKIVWTLTRVCNNDEHDELSMNRKRQVLSSFFFFFYCYFIHSTKMNRFLEIKKLSEFKELISQNKLVFVQFTTTMCHPSKMIGPYLEKLTTNYPQVQFAKVYIDKYAVSYIKHSVKHRLT